MNYGDIFLLKIPKFHNFILLYIIFWKLAITLCSHLFGLLFLFISVDTDYVALSNMLCSLMHTNKPLFYISVQNICLQGQRQKKKNTEMSNVMYAEALP